MSNTPSGESLKTTVIGGGYCIGCGACTRGLPKEGVSIGWNKQGQYEASIVAEHEVFNIQLNRVCPFSTASHDENFIASKFFKHLPNHEKIGRYRACYAGYVTESEFRSKGSSGGMVSWLLVELLRSNFVDEVIHVGNTEKDQATDGPLFKYVVSSTQEEVSSRSKSRYYPVEMSEVLNHIRANDRRYAFVGVPCFIKALRLLQLNEPIFRERVIFTIGIFCGHLKSKGFSEILAFQAGMQPEKINGIDFRTKLPGHLASRYAVTVDGFSLDKGIRQEATKPMMECVGKNWSHGLFKYKACDFCDDVVAETADVAIGDAWLPQYIKDSNGTNILVVRDSKIQSIIESGIRRGALSLDEVSPTDVVNSQAGGFRHRREGLAYRLAEVDKAGKWRPKKRVAADDKIGSPLFRQLQSMRTEIREFSHTKWFECKNSKNFSYFFDLLSPLLEKHDHIASLTSQERSNSIDPKDLKKKNSIIRIFSKLKRTFRTCFR